MISYNFTDRVRATLQMAREEAHRLQHEYVGTEHLLLGIIREGQGIAATVLTNLGANLGKMKARIEELTPRGPKPTTLHPDLPYTSSGKRVLELAMAEARDLDHSYVGTEHLLLALLLEDRGVAAQALGKCGVRIDGARTEVLRLLAVGDSSGLPRVPAREGDHRFKTAIALIELHRLRFGEYPDALKDLRFLSDHNPADLVGLKYEKLGNGYALDVVLGTRGTPDLAYPAEFWRGLGIRRTNVGGLPHSGGQEP